MLKLVDDDKRKVVLQSDLEAEFKSILNFEGIRNIGFPGGNFNLPIFSAGEGRLWAAFGGVDKSQAINRYWNAFGVLRGDSHAQSIAVEVNIPVGGNSKQVAGFFAEDLNTGDILLMHSGKVGGGRVGVGKSAFLVWSKADLVEVAEEGGGVRLGVVVTKLGAPDIISRTWKFVEAVRSFKDAVIEGKIETAEFKKQVREFDNYRKEYSGKKRGVRGGAIEYHTYHGQVVQKLYDEINARVSSGEIVANNQLVDLMVKNNGVVTEIYEVKTSVDRQVLYTAIGQILTHSAPGSEEVAKILVIPAGESVPADLARAIDILGIKVRRFALKNIANGDEAVELD